MTAQEMAVLAGVNESEARVLREAFRLSDADLEFIANDPSIASSIKVQFEGEWCVWGDLTVMDRKAYLAGGYPY